MADAIRKAIRKIRHKHKRQDPPMSPKWYVELKYQAKMDELWENDKIINRDFAFQKARIKLNIVREEKKKKDEALYKQRIQNLKKARKAKAKIFEET